jgi:hypothetical protein
MVSETKVSEMPTQDQFRQRAVDYSDRLREYTRPLAEQIRELRVRLSQVENAFAALRLAVHRQYTYSPGTEPEWNCPHCWVQNKRLARLNSARIGHEEVWHCDVCGDVAQTTPLTPCAAE